MAESNQKEMVGEETLLHGDGSSSVGDRESLGPCGGVMREYGQCLFKLRCWWSPRASMRRHKLRCSLILIAFALLCSSKQALLCSSSCFCIVLVKFSHTTPSGGQLQPWSLFSCVHMIFSSWRVCVREREGKEDVEGDAVLYLNAGPFIIWSLPAWKTPMVHVIQLSDACSSE
jgi:hypothetical protein